MGQPGQNRSKLHRNGKAWANLKQFRTGDALNSLNLEISPEYQKTRSKDNDFKVSSPPSVPGSVAPALTVSSGSKAIQDDAD